MAPKNRISYMDGPFEKVLPTEIRSSFFEGPTFLNLFTIWQKNIWHPLLWEPCHGPEVVPLGFSIEGFEIPN